MKYRIKKRYLYKFLKKCRVLYDEQRIEILEDRWHIKGVDPAHTCIVDQDLHKSAFERYTKRGLEDEKETIGVNIDWILDILSLFKYEDVIQIDIDQEEHYMSLSSGNLQDNEMLLDTAGFTDFKVPSLKYAYKITNIENSDLRDIIKLINRSEDHMYINILDGERVQLRSPHDWEMRSTLELDQDDEDIQIKRLDEPDDEEHPGDTVECSFALDYLQDISKSIHKNKTIDQIKINQDYPMELMIREEENQIETRFLLAPRIETR